LGLTVQTGLATKTITGSSLAVVKLATQCGITLRQPYTFIGQQAFVRSARYAHARQFNRAAAHTKKLRTMLGRVMRDTQRKAERKELPAKARAGHCQPHPQSAACARTG
jgi:transposase, IS5 family